MNSAAVNVCVDMFSFLVGVHLRVRLLCHVLPLCLTPEELSNCFPKQLHRLTFLPVTCQGSIPHILVNTFICFFKILATLVSVKWYLKILICISLMLVMLTSFHVFKGHLYILWRNVYIAPLPILKIG